MSKAATRDRRVNRPSPRPSGTATSVCAGPSTISTHALALRWREHGDRWAREALIDRFRPLARRLARRYASRAEQLEDLSAGPSRWAWWARSIVLTRTRGQRLRRSRFRRFLGSSSAISGMPGGPRMFRVALRNWPCVSTTPRGISPLTPDAHRTWSELAQYLEVDTEQVLAGLEAGSAPFAMSLDAPVATPDTEVPEPLHAQYRRTGRGVRPGGDDGLAGRRAAATALSGAPCPDHAFRRQPQADRDRRAARLHTDAGSRLLRRAGTRLRDVTDPDTPQRLTSSQSTAVS